MVTRQTRLVSRLGFIIIVLFIIVVAGLIARHTDRTFAPVRAQGGEWATIADMPSLPEPPIEEYSVVIGQTVFGNYDSWRADTALLRDSTAAGLLPSDESQVIPAFAGITSPPPSRGLMWPAGFSDAPTAFPDSTVHLECDTADLGSRPAVFLNIPDAIPADDIAGSIEEPAAESHVDAEQGTVLNRGTKQPADGNNNTPAPSEQEVDKIGDTAKTSAPPKQGPIKIRTTIGSVETVLKEALIEPYCVNGRIEGLRITGLERVSAAGDLPLKSGDIIRAINGQPLDSKRRALKIFKKARTLPIMMVDLLRDGQTKALLLDLR
jgi:hypothetical protein